MTKAMRILIPMDGSIPGQASLYAIQPLIQSGPVECTLLHVLEDPKAGDSQEHRLDAHRQTLESLGVPTRVRVVGGKPAEEVLRAAGSGDFDVVAMATHGRRGLDRVMMGSVAEEVVRSCPIPALLCRTGVHVQGWERLVVALDGLPGAEQVLEDVMVLAKRLGAAVHLLRVGLNINLSNCYRGVAFEAEPQDPPSYLEDVAQRFRAQGISVETDHRSGMAASEISMYAKELDAGLICMTTQGRPEELPGLGRSVAAEVIRQAPCPVYVRRMTVTSSRSCIPG